MGWAWYRYSWPMKSLRRPERKMCGADIERVNIGWVPGKKFDVAPRESCLSLPVMAIMKD